MLTLQIIVSIFVASNIWRIVSQLKSQKITASSFFWWLILWLIVLVVFWVPDSTGYLAQLLGITRGADLMIYASVLLIFYLLFKIFIRLNKTDEAITKIVRQRALENKDINEQK
jgi:hypothetical protein